MAGERAHGDGSGAAGFGHFDAMAFLAPERPLRPFTVKLGVAVRPTCASAHGSEEEESHQGRRRRALGVAPTGIGAASASASAQALAVEVA